MCAAAGATAQTRSAASASAADSVLLSECTDGDYIVRRYMIKSQGDAEYSVRYRINLAKLSSTLNGNAKELDELNTFLGKVMDDSLIQVRSADITGYASPDGPLAYNQSLAKRRAQDFKNFVDKKYDLSKKYDVEVSSEAENWEACRSLVEQNNVPDKQAVLRIIDGSQSREAKEQALKKMPGVWDYLKQNVLPPLRRVELVIYYNQARIVEQRTMIPRPQPVPEPQPRMAECCCDVVVDEAITGLLVEMPEPGQDLDRYGRQIGQEFYQIEKTARREERIARKLAKKEAREAQRMARAEAKAAKRSYRELERGVK